MRTRPVVARGAGEAPARRECTVPYVERSHQLPGQRTCRQSASPAPPLAGSPKRDQRGRRCRVARGGPDRPWGPTINTPSRPVRQVLWRKSSRRNTGGDRAEASESCAVAGKRDASSAVVVGSFVVRRWLRRRTPETKRAPYGCPRTTRGDAGRRGRTSSRSFPPQRGIPGWRDGLQGSTLVRSASAR